MREDAGQLERSCAADQQALQLAVANNDPATASPASFGKVRQMLDQNRLDEAQTVLNAVLAGYPKVAPALLTVAAHSVPGDVFNAQARFDKALASYLSALKAEERTPAAGESRANLGIRIAQIYLNTDNPAKAVQTIEQALAEPGLPDRMSGRLQASLGVALVRLGRTARDKAIAALQEEYAARQRTREIDALRHENRRKDADLHSRRMLQLVTTFAAVRQRPATDCRLGSALRGRQEAALDRIA